MIGPSRRWRWVMDSINKCLQFYLQYKTQLWFIAFIISNIGWIIMWFAKTRKYWHEGTRVKKLIHRMDMEKWLEEKVNEAYNIVCNYYKSKKDNGAFQLIDESIIK